MPTNPDTAKALAAINECEALLGRIRTRKPGTANAVHVARRGRAR